MPQRLFPCSPQRLLTSWIPGPWPSLQAQTHFILCAHILMLCRALGEYATINNAAKEGAAKDLVNRTFGTIQDFDFQLFSANRNKQPVGKEAETKLDQAISAMDDLLATVPADSMSKARVRAIAANTAAIQCDAACCRSHSHSKMSTGRCSRWIRMLSATQEVLQAVESRALARSNGDAVEAYDEQMLQRLVPDAS